MSYSKDLFQNQLSVYNKYNIIDSQLCHCFLPTGANHNTIASHTAFLYILKAKCFVEGKLDFEQPYRSLKYVLKFDKMSWQNILLSHLF